MLIISKFHDYYDSAIGYGVDKTVIYNRKTFYLKKKIEIPSTRKLKKEGELDFVIIGFCGNIYPLIIKNETLFYYNKEEYSKDFDLIKSKGPYYHWLGQIHLNENFINDFYDSNYWSGTLSFFQKYKVPCFLLKHGREGLIE